MSSSPDLDRARTALAALAATQPPDPGDRSFLYNPDLDTFLAVLAALGRGRVAVAPEEIERFLRETAPLVDKAIWALSRIRNQTEHFIAGEFWGGEWPGICERRTQLEFFVNVYRPLLDPDPELWLDCADLDDLLHQKRVHEGSPAADEIPPGTPTSHWWWWPPELPPA